MRLGLVDTWMSERYLPFWRAYLRELGAELLEPRLPVSEALARLEEPWPRPARLLAARVLELKARGAEAIFVPEAVGESPRGTGTCPWAVDPASMLERVLPGLPPLVRVPSELAEGVLGLAARIGQELVQNPQEVRRALDRTRQLLKPYKPPAMPRGARLLGLAAMPYLLGDERLYPEVLAAAEAAGWTPVRPDASPERLREEGARTGLNIDLPADLEFAGAAHYLGRLGRVAGLLLVVDDHCPPEERLARRLAATTPKPVAVHVLGEDPQTALERIQKATR
ncbi:hypothetical protein [Oceanithermus desulfurans]|uniref:DUF2229 domain-containing protein n=2 Tax=Oceanithermus desulfurans TaxID=227924 RepID=A0A511RKB4_9DEIN|nr:hypothetical protein [Oceanithermus desulfurans]MBB6030595.1 hypothetical protein [Oceanithermus desulfurans]GEM89527.1 hypothetical protein ODE01S_09610 [Oceanithermus desulfurans NBRC 100063]